MNSFYKASEHEDGSGACGGRVCGSANIGRHSGRVAESGAVRGIHVDQKSGLIRA